MRHFGMDILRGGISGCRGREALTGKAFVAILAKLTKSYIPFQEK